MLCAELFQVLLQLICREATHFHTTAIRDSAGDQLQLQLWRSFLGVLTINLKEITHLIQDHIIRVALLDAVVVPHSRVRLLSFHGIRFGPGLFRLDFIVLRLLLFGEIASLLIRSVIRLGDFLPGEMHIRAAIFFIVQSFSIIIFMTAHCARQGMGAPSDAILMPEKINLFLICMGGLEKGKIRPLPPAKPLPPVMAVSISSSVMNCLTAGTSVN